MFGVCSQQEKALSSLPAPQFVLGGDHGLGTARLAQRG